MCGISGLVTTSPNRPPTRALLSAMNDAVAHRGPDGEGYWLSETAGFAHRRLSILDLSEQGAQPMLSADGRYVLVCNGEIYNYRAIRRQLVKDGYPFRSQTDVEVILPLYERYGPACVEHLAGMFALAIWDCRERKLFLARDRIGEKPLFFWSDGQSLAFCSEIKGLLQLPFVHRKLNEASVAHLQIYQSLPAPHTIFAGIEALPPASTLLWADGRRTQQRYWRVDFSRRRNWSWSNALEAYDANLHRSVDEGLVADVPVGITLSGGVDSSAIAVMASRLHPEVRSFSIGRIQDGELDIEHKRATQVASILGLRHANLDFEAPHLADFSDVFGGYDQPMWCGVALYADKLAETMRRQVKVAVSGNGADEVLAGYANYARLPFEGSLRRAASVAGLGQRLARFAGERVARLLGSSAGPMHTWRANALAQVAGEQIRRLCTPEGAARLSSVDLTATMRGYAEECAPQSYLDTVLYTDLMAYHQHGHCTIPDISGMRHGLEIRAPFLDHRFVEFAASLPQRMLLSLLPDRRRTKFIAKRHLARFLPNEIVNAPKIGFGYAIPLNDMILKEQGNEVRRRLTTGAYLELGLFSRSGAEWAMAHSPTATWMLLTFADWVDRHLFGLRPQPVEPAAAV